MAENKVNINQIAKIDQIKSGDYLIIETPEGTKILDFKNFFIDVNNTSFSATITGHTTDISDNTSLISQLTAAQTVNTSLVSTVSGLTGLMWRDTWSNSTAYKLQDAVEYSNSSFVAIAESTNEAPAAGDALNSSYWNYLAKAGTVTLPLSTANALLSYNGTALTEIAPAAAGYTLKSKGSSSAPEWQLPDTGKPRAVCAQLGETYHDISASAPWETSLPFIMTDGTVRIGGDDSEVGHMSLGRAYDDGQVYQTPEQMLFDTRTFNYSADKIKQVYVSCYESYAVMSGGDVYHTGNNNNGMGGDGSTTTRSLFRRIEYFSDNNLPIDRVFFQNDLTLYTEAYSTAFFLTTAGDLYAAGYNGNGNCGIGNTTSPQTTPVKVQNIGKDEAPGKVEEVWTIMNSSANTTYAKCADGKVYGWGYNAGYKLGLGHNTSSQTSPIELPPLSGTILMKAQNASSYSGSNAFPLYGAVFALLSNGRLKYAGNDQHGHCIFGDGNSAAHYATVWTDMSGVSAWKDFDVMSDWNSSAVGLHEDGSVYAWGYNADGQIDGLTTAEATTPMKLDNVTGCLNGSFQGSTWDIRGTVKRVMSTKVPTGNTGQSARSNILITNSNEIYSAGRSSYTGGYADTNNADVQVYLPLASNSHPQPETRGYQKWTLPCDPSEIKEIKTSCQNHYSYYHSYNVYILTNDGKVFISGYAPPGCRPAVGTHGNFRYWTQVEF